MPNHAPHQFPHVALGQRNGGTRKLRLEVLEARNLLSITPLAPEFQVNTWSTGSQWSQGASGRSVANDDAGNFVVTWTSEDQAGGSGNDIYAQRYTADGTALGSEFRVNESTTGDQRSSSVAMDSDGDFIVTWLEYTTGTGRLSGRRYDANGEPKGNTFPAWGNNTQSNPTVAMDAAGNFVIVFTMNAIGIEDQSNIYALRYNSNGTFLSPIKLINSQTTGMQRSPSIAMEADGEFVVAWESRDGADYNVYAQRFSPSATPIGSQFLVHDPNTRSQISPEVAVDADGNFVIAWLNSGNLGFDINAQRFDNQGMALGSNFRVSTFPTNRLSLDLELDADGDFIAVWQTVTQEENWDKGNFQGIYGRQFTKDGIPLTKEFHVNDYISGNQTVSALTMAPNGNLVIVWQSNGQDGSGNAIIARRYTTDFTLSNVGPTTTGMGNLTLVEDAPDYVLDLRTQFTDTEQEPQELTYSLMSNSNPALTAASVNAGQLTLDLTPDMWGNVTVNVRATDILGAFVELPVNVTVYPINDAPVLSVNAGLSALEGQPLTLSAANLLATDVDTPASQLTYTLTTLPVRGSLQKNSVPLAVQSTFTQQDILDGLIRYVHSGNETVTDSFGFQLTDGAIAGTFVRASVAFDGNSANGASGNASLSPDGTLLLFESLASNLVAGDINGRRDVFVRNLVTGVTSRVSVGSADAEANHDSFTPRFSTDNRYVIFESAASNLVDNDTNGVNDIFIRDLQTQLTTRLSLSPLDGEANGDSTLASFSGDGRFATFASIASNLVPGDTDSFTDIFVSDLRTGSIVRATVPAATGTINNHSTAPFMTANGHRVFFTSLASMLVSSDSNNANDVFYRDLIAGNNTRASVSAIGFQIGGSSVSYYPSVSSDGRYLTYYSTGTNIVSSDTNARTDIFLRDLEAGVNSRVSVSSTGAQLTGNSTLPAISQDGRYVVFQSDANTVVTGDSNGADDIFVRDLLMSTNRRISLTATGTASNGASSVPTLSADGRFIAFQSVATNLVTSDTNGVSDVFVRDTGNISATANIAITLVNDPPTLDVLNSLTLLENAAQQTINLSGITAGPGESQTISVAALSSNPALIPNPSITYSSPGATGTLQFTPAANQTGTAVITVTVSDSGGTANGAVDQVVRKFTVYVRKLADTISPVVTGIYAAGPDGIVQTNPLASGGFEQNTISKLVVAFSKNMATTGLENITSAHNWQLTRNDVDISTRISGITFGFSAPNNRYEAVLTLASPLHVGSYALTARSALQDLFGNRLDGLAVATPQASDYRHPFSVAQDAAMAGDLQINTYTTGQQGPGISINRTGIATDAQGNFVVVWQGSGTGDVDGVFGQRFNAAGAKLGSEFRVNTYTMGAQVSPRVAMTPGGQFVVTWASNGQDGSGYAVEAQRFDSSGNTVGSEFQVNSLTLQRQDDPAIAMSADGAFVIVWNGVVEGDFLAVAAQRYDAAGQPIGTQFRVSNYSDQGQVCPHVAMEQDGDFIVTWSSRFQDSSVYGIYAQRYNANGTLRGSEFRVNTYTTNDQQNSTVAIDVAGNFAIVWESSDQDGNSYGVFGQLFAETGLPVGTEFRINSYTTGSQRLAMISMAPEGDFFVTWQSQQDGSGYGIYGRRYDAAGNVQGNEFRINTVTQNSQLASNAVRTPTGGLVAAWSSNQQDGQGYGIFSQVYESVVMLCELRVAGEASPILPGEKLQSQIPSGASLTATFSGTLAETGSGSVTNPANWLLTRNGVDVSSWISGVSYLNKTATITLNTLLGEGEYVVSVKNTLQTAAGRPLQPGGVTIATDFARAFTIQETLALGSEFRVNSYTTGNQLTHLESHGAVAMSDNGDYVVVWTGSGQDGSIDGVFAQRYNAAGAPLGTEFRVNTFTANNQRMAAAAMDADGDFVIVWSSGGQETVSSGDTGIYARLYNSAGVPLGTEFHVNTFSADMQEYSTVAMDADGDFVVTWSSYAQDGSSWGVYAQQFNALGTRVGSEFRVNQATGSAQAFSNVAMSARGDFVITWTSSLGIPNGDDVFAQPFRADGTRLGSEFRVNSYTTNTQSRASVAMDDAGNFVVAWLSTPHQDGSWNGVFAKRFSLAGTPLGSEFRANGYTTDNQSDPTVAMDADGDFTIVWRSNGFTPTSAQDGNGYGIYARRYNASGVLQGSEFRINSYTTGAQNVASIAMDADGDAVAVWSSQAQDGSSYGVYAQRFGAAAPLKASQLTPTYDGFELAFNSSFQSAVLNLHDLTGPWGIADVTLTGASVGAVRGSVVLDRGTQKLTFIKSGGPLAPDTYTVSLRSHAAGFTDAGGHLLDGNGDGFASDDYTARFAIAPPAGVSLAIADFVRGYGPNVNLPSGSNVGIPITITSALDLQYASLALNYDPALLTITGAQLGPGISGVLTVDTSQAGQAIITVSSGTQFSAASGPQTLVSLTAAVPASALYAAKQVLDLENLQILDSARAAVAAINDDAIHIAAYFGDANGSQTYNAPDATLAQRIIVGSDTLLPAYPLADPYLLIDINGNGQVQSDDVTQIQRAIVGLSTVDVPAHPGQMPVAAAGPDPIVYIPRDLSASVGERITVPVELLVTERSGIELAGVDLAIAYDATRLELNDVQVGKLLVGFGINANLATPGLIKLSIAGNSTLELPFDSSGVLAELDFRILAGSGPTTINLLQSADSLHTALYDDLGRSLLLQPAPSNEDDDSVDGLIELLAVDQLLQFE